MTFSSSPSALLPSAIHAMSRRVNMLLERTDTLGSGSNVKFARRLMFVAPWRSMLPCLSPNVPAT